MKVVELTVIFAVVAAMAATVIKVYEWRQDDVLYGPDLGSLVTKSTAID
jgi:hypothetical protein